jgi:lipopolysaccharide transport system ATP-binding protein
MSSEIASLPEIAVECESAAKAFQLYIRRNDQLYQALFGWWKQFYKDHWVLRDVSFQVRRGETIGIVGRNGAGKTTLLQILCGITTPTRGSVRVAGRLAPILALGAAFDGSLTGRENAMIGCAILGLKHKQIEQRLQAIVDFAEVGMFFDQPMKLYSSGMVARLAFAICAHVDADILIVDEALSVGDEYFAAKCEAFIRNFSKNDGTIIVVSHGLDYLMTLCDRVMWIDDGRVREIGDPKMVIEAYRATVTRESEAEDEEAA